MKILKKKTASVLAALLAVLVIVPSDVAVTAAEKNTNNTGEDSPTHWTTELPTEGDGDYTTDKSWHRLVLEYGDTDGDGVGDYCTNSEDSEGNYADISPDSESSWPSYAWSNSAEANRMAGGQPENWLGQNETERVRYGTAVREGASDLYRNGEYSMTGLHSLYIKYAGTSRDGQACYYISPCDSNGDREDKLWALDCCLDLTGADLTTDQFTSNLYQNIGVGSASDATGLEAISEGIEPCFKLLTPTYTEYETEDNFKYAGIAISYYKRTNSSTTGRDEGDYDRCDQEVNTGHIYGNYIDNNKWIITQNDDGSWAIKSAGYIDWNWSDSTGDLALLLGTTNLSEKFANGIAEYIKAYCYAQNSYTVEQSSENNDYDVFERYYIAPYAAKSFVYYTTGTAHLTAMLWLDEYAQNVYILGGYNHWGTRSGTSDVTQGAIGNQITTGYDMHFYVNVSFNDYQKWVYTDISNSKKEYGVVYSTTGDSPAKTVGISVSDSDGYLTTEELKKSLPVEVAGGWCPTKDSGAFLGLYVGTALESETYNAQNGSVTISEGVTVTLGESDKNGDGVCDKVAFIGTPLTMGGTGTTTQIIIEEGGTLQIDGPTYAALGTEIIVYGTLIISSGAFLGVEDVESTSCEGSSYAGIRFGIYGSVIISNGAMLDVGYASVAMYSGSITNNGVYVQSGLNKYTSNWALYFFGGDIVNNSSALFISGASVRDNCRMRLINIANGSVDKTSLAVGISNVYDYSLSKYSNGTYSDGNADIRFCDSSSEERVFKNNGLAFVAGAIKGETDSGNYWMGDGTLLRGRDYYEDTVIVEGADFSYHKKICTPAVKENNEILNKYYDLTNIQVGSVFNPGGRKTECLNNNVLALRVGTGSTGTDKITNFTITYVDTDGVTHTENIVDPANISSTYSFVGNWEKCGTSEDISGYANLKTHGGTADYMSSTSFSKELEPYTNVTYVFKSSWEVSYIESISFTGSGTSSWSCTELSLYRVEYLYPLEEYGWCSYDWYVPFSGTLLAEVPLTEDTSTGTKGDVFSWSGAEKIEFGTGLRRLNVYEVPSTVKSRSDSTGFKYYNASSNTVSYSTQEEDYVFSLSLADTNNSGIESYYNVASDISLEDLMSDPQFLNKLKEDVVITMDVYYIDTNGSVRKASLPFTLSAFEWAYSELSGTERAENIHGLFQQGEDIAFSGCLPDFASVYEVYINYTDTDPDATIAVVAASVSKPTASTVSVSVDSGILEVDYPDTAVSFFCASDVNGVYAYSGQKMKIQMKNWNGTQSLKPQAKGSRYLVVIETDEMTDAATARDISVQFTYTTLGGLSSTTEIYDLRTAVNDYYGYWLSADGTDSGCAYKRAVSTNGEMYFVVDIENLYEFTSATFSIEKDDEDDTYSSTDYDSTGKDEWQMSAITIYELSELGQRKVVLGQGITAMGTTTNRTYYRVNRYGSRGAVNRGSGPLMVGPGQSKTITFEDGEEGSITGGGEVISENKATDIQSLSYEETKQDFGFNSKRSKYLVTVQVAGKSITSVEDGDCGSQNQFYFQLVFQDSDGKLNYSPCVLSNQQLKSDGFRTGTAEEFVIYTNDDYGTPIQINIIPDDTSSTSDVFDKLCIDYITVSKTSSTGVSINWTASDVGWIDIEYKDDGEEQTGRTEAQLVRSFELENSGYNVWIEFGIETAATYIDNEQYIGQVLADITYRDTNGSIKTKSNISVVGSIADYAERMTELGTASDGTEVSVPTYMFRKGYTNRFLVQFDDISSLINIRFKLTPASTSANDSWSISSVFARQVYNEGTLSLNIFNEYQHYYAQTPSDLASSTNGSAVNIETNGGSASATFVFNTGNSISISTDDEEVEVEEGETEGANDYITVTAELNDITGIDTSSTISARVIYKNIYGDAYAVRTTLVYDDDTEMFMIPESDLPSTPDIGMPYQVELTSDKLTGQTVKKVTVTHMRESYALSQVEFLPGEGSKLDEEVPLVISVPDSKVDEYADENGYTSESQKVYIKLGSGTQTTLLTQSKDLKVALVYILENDPYSVEYVSDYVSALDCGYSVIDSSSTLCIPMSVSGIGTIRGIMLKTGDSTMKISAETGCVSVTKTSNLSGGTISSGWVNLPYETGLITTEGTRMSSDGSSLSEALSDASRISPINVTAKLSTIKRADAILKLTLFYTDIYGATQSESCEMLASDWNYSGTYFLVSGLKAPSYYKLEVYDNDTSNLAGVTVSSVDVDWYDTSGIYNSFGVDESISITEGTGEFGSLISTELTGTVSCSAEESIKLEDNPASGEEADYDVLTVSGNTDVTVSASLPGFNGEIEVFAVNESTGVNVFGFQYADSSEDSMSYTFQFPVNTGNKNVRYELTVRSKTFPQQYASVVYIDVVPAMRIEGASFDSNGNIIKEFDLYSAESDDLTSGTTFRSGQTLTVYARVLNDAGGLSYEIVPEEGSEVTVTVTEDSLLSGYTGTFTKYVITAGTITTNQEVTFRVYSVTDENVGYTLKFKTEPTAQ